MTIAMTVAERLELGKVVRLNAKVAKAEVAALAARRLADVEAQLAAKYSANHDAWAEIAAAAKNAVAKADAKIAEHCVALGILPEFRPGLNVSWYDRGENGDSRRRSELRRVAHTEIESCVRTAQAEIDRCMARQLTDLSSGLITSDEGRAFLAAMPAIDQLVPPIMLTVLEETNPARLAP